jgi:hypothetical protein
MRATDGVDPMARLPPGGACPFCGRVADALSSAERRGNRDAVLRRLAEERHSGSSGRQAIDAIRGGLDTYETDGPWRHDRKHGLDPKHIGMEREAYYALLQLGVPLGETTIKRAITGFLGQKRHGDGPKVPTQRGR